MHCLLSCEYRVEGKLGFRKTRQRRECQFIKLHIGLAFRRLKRTKLNYRFHNPNSAEDTADFLCRLLIEVNVGKVEQAIEDATLYVESGDYILENLLENKGKIMYGVRGARRRTLLFLLW